MERFDPSAFITNSSLVTDIFGYWPSFHDAWILSLTLSVADGEPWNVGSVSPTAEMIIHLSELTDETNHEGYLIIRKHTRVRIVFQNVQDSTLADFRYQNAIFEMVFGVEPMTYRNGGPPLDGPHPNVLTVAIESSIGLSGTFKCQSATVVSAEPCDEFGKLLAPTA